jgi:hypothetical protein
MDSDADPLAKLFGCLKETNPKSWHVTCSPLQLEKPVIRLNRKESEQAGNELTASERHVKSFGLPQFESYLQKN